MGTATDFFTTTARNWRARLAVSVELMRELSRYSDPEELYLVFSRRMAQLYPTTRQVTISRRGLDRPAFRVTRSSLWAEPHQPMPERERPIWSGGILAELLYEDQPRVIDDLNLTPDDPANQYFVGQRSLLAIPLFDHGTAQNMVVVSREEAAAFPREQVPELVWLSNLFGRATQTLVLSTKLQELYDAADYELRTIGELQQSLLPEGLPCVPGLDIAAHYQTANRAGGDYYDFFALPDGRLTLLVADVSGHGTPAAVLMAILHSLAHAIPEPPSRPGEFLSYLNLHLAKHYTLTTGNFVTALCAVFDPVRGTVTVANAGHTPPRIRSLQGKPEFTPTDLGRRLPLGVTHRTQAPYPELVLPFGQGDELVFFTDGIVEAENRKGEPFGLDRLDEALVRPAGDARTVVNGVLQSWMEFIGRPESDDDCTLVFVRGDDLASPKPEKSRTATLEI
jgi:sigma-B regulation protein RsbU (phosphoserine phosphatase)